MQELDKFNLKINVIPDGLEKYTSFSINNNSFHFLRFSLSRLVKNLAKYDLKYLSQDNNVIDLVQEKRISSLLVYEQFWKV